jgi:hypothetical protein
MHFISMPRTATASRRNTKLYAAAGIIIAALLIGTGFVVWTLSGPLTGSSWDQSHQTTGSEGKTSVVPPRNP